MPNHFHSLLHIHLVSFGTQSILSLAHTPSHRYMFTLHNILKLNTNTQTHSVLLAAHTYMLTHISTWLLTCTHNSFMGSHPHKSGFGDTHTLCTMLVSSLNKYRLL